MSQIERVIAEAERHLGVKESPPDSNDVCFNTAYYGRKVSGPDYPWCCVFVWYVFRAAGLSGLFYGGGKIAGCTTLMSHAIAKKQFFTSGFRRGDLALFNWNGGTGVAHHIGIITQVQGGRVITIEGNTAIGNDSNGSEVMRREREPGSIIGVYRPEYKEEASMDTNNIKAAVTELSGTGGSHSPWAEEAVQTLVNAGVFRGDGDGNFGWGQLVTRETLAQVIFNTLYILRNGGADEYGK